MISDAKESLDIILNCMSGSDGGVNYVHLNILVKSMQGKADLCDAEATQICEIVNNMAKLVKYAAKL